MEENNEWRVYGPPGTGKTTWLSKHIRKAAATHGYDKVVVMSFTKAAAVELAGKDLPIDKHNVGTIHAICYRGLGDVKIAENLVDDFNKEFPLFALSPAKASPLDEASYELAARATENDELMAEYQRLRGKMVIPDMWPLPVRRFAERWETWKRSSGLMDFTDLLETGYHDFERCPGNPSVIMVDEAQDMNPLMTALVRKWGAGAEYFILVGDDDQTIYRFIGADPEAFLATELPPERERVLSQSHRVPAAVQAWAEKWIRQVSKRAAKEYKPRDCEGEVRPVPGVNYHTPDKFLRDVEQYLEQNKTVMVLAPCSYQLEEYKAAFRKEGLPFHNPYRRSNGGWNPLTPARGTPAIERLLAFLRPENELWDDGARPWTYGDVAKWIDAIAVKDSGLRHGVKTAVPELAKVQPDKILRFDEIFDLVPEVEKVFLQGTVDDRIDWFRSHLTSKHSGSMDFPLNILESRGGMELTATPKVILGTIHSVKGGQADVVYMVPDISVAGNEEWKVIGPPRDSVIRQFYVGATRARETLCILDPGTRYSVPVVA